MAEQSSLIDARDLLTFVDASPTPYHAVAEAIRRLKRHGSTTVDERAAWNVEPGASLHVVKSGGTLCAVRVGTKPPWESGFRIVGAHTDSPGFRVKPSPHVESAGHRQFGVETYGGVLIHTWFDRDLGLAGRIALVDGSTHLLRVDQPLCRIPNLAIHLNRKVNTDGFRPNKQQHTVPVMGLSGEGKRPLLDVIRDRLAADGVDAPVEAMAGFDLAPFDVQASSVGGVDDEFIFAPRLDNLASCHAAIEALERSGEDREATRVVILYDHEEIGSQSDGGAKSRFLGSVLDRVALGFEAAPYDAVERSRANSLLVSADMAHGVHPNYTDKHDKQHKPKLGGGPVIKVNANRSYATDGPSTAYFQRLCEDAGFKPQRFVSRNDMPCGGTIGSISAAQLGMRAVDVGNPMLSMHSCREMAATGDVTKMIDAMRVAFCDASLPPPAS